MTDTTETTINPLTSAAASLIKLEDGAQKPNKHAVEDALQAEAMQIAQNDLSGMEAMLSHQTQMLHRVFTHSLEKYAGVSVPENSRIYSNIALKAQSYCRLTMSAITQIKKAEEQAVRCDNEATLKLQNKLLKRSHS